MKVALFGGTFDPIHGGHLSAARAARDIFSLDRVHFVPAGRPPHRRRQPLSPFEHRYAMVALACAGEPGFVPSLVEAPAARGVHYSIRTVKRVRRTLSRSDELFFIVGADAFLEFRTWWQWRALLNAVNLIIVSRPGFDLEAVRHVIPAELIRRDAGQAGAVPLRGTGPEARGRWRRRPAVAGNVHEVRLLRTTAHILAGVMQPVSATEVRGLARDGGDFSHLVPPSVADYIRKQHLYE